MMRALATLAVLACLAFCVDAGMGVLPNLVNVAQADKFVAGPSSLDWYNQDEETVSFSALGYCGYIYYSPVIHFGCKQEEPMATTWTPPVQAGTCAFDSSQNWYQVIPGISADQFTATCFMTDTGACGAPQCAGTQIHVSGIYYIYANVYSVGDPINSILNAPDLSCTNLPLPTRRSQGARSPRARRDGHLRRSARQNTTHVDVDMASAEHKKDHHYPKHYKPEYQPGPKPEYYPSGPKPEYYQPGPKPDYQYGPKPDDYQYGPKPDYPPGPYPNYYPAPGGPLGTPPTVYKGYAIVFSGYFVAINKQQRRTVGDGDFELVWPIDNNVYSGLPAWEPVTASVPRDAMYIKNPYTITLQYWNDGKRE